MALRLLNSATATNSPPANTAATGSITAVAGSALTEDTYFVLSDGINPHVKFIFDSDASVTETAFVRKVAYTVGDSSATVHTAIINAINSATPTLAITASDGGGAVVTLTHDVAGTVGNNTRPNVDNTSACTCTTMSGGVDAGFSLTGEYTPGTQFIWLQDDCGEIQVKSTAGSGTMSVTLRVWGYGRWTRAWHPLGSNSTEASRGVLNNASAIDEDGSDNLTHTEPLVGLSGFTRIYLEITAISGTNTAVSAYLVPVSRSISDRH